MGIASFRGRFSRRSRVSDRAIGSATFVSPSASGEAVPVTEPKTLEVAKIGEDVLSDTRLEEVERARSEANVADARTAAARR